MIGRCSAGVIAIGAALQGCAPPPPVPVCAQPGVLRQVYEAVRKRGQELVLEAPPVGEISTGVVAAAAAPGPAPDRPPLAQCAVRGHTLAYDTNRYGASPVHESFTLRYTVELRRNGIFVQVD